MEPRSKKQIHSTAYSVLCPCLALRPPNILATIIAVYRFCLKPGGFMSDNKDMANDSALLTENLFILVIKHGNQKTCLYQRPY